jgi:AraC family transcriptional regulator of adaptative response/methylated-DNA-[protein]-cysteine methyltransferase
MTQPMQFEEREFWKARYWQAVVNREPEMDGAVYYAVLSTGVYCRPSCASRKPRRDNVVFFPRGEDAEKAGFRPCLRCRPDQAARNGRFELTVDVCRYLEAHAEEPVRLATLGRELGFSPFHIQRTFRALLGVTPRQWAEQRKLERFKERVRGGGSVTEALYEAGYGSSSRLYEQGSSRLGMTPAAYGKGGAGLAIEYTVADCELGKVLVAATGRGVCAIRFGDSDQALETGLPQEFPRARIERNDAGLELYAGAVQRLIAGSEEAIPLDIRATAFQRRVWDALQRIPRGQTRSYAQVAAEVGNARATRAVARACAANPVAVAIPCHRVVPSTGQVGGYRWGADRKRRLLEAERASAKV